MYGGCVQIICIYKDSSGIENGGGNSSLGTHGGINNTLIAKEVGILHNDALQ